MTPEQLREQAENGVVMEEKTDVPKLADVLDDARVKVCIGLEQQGHIPTVEKMLAEGKTWEEIGEVIGWYGPTAEEWYGLYLKAREESQAPPADLAVSQTIALAEAHERVEELEYMEREEAAFMAKRGVLYNCTFIDGWARVLDERDEAREQLAEKDKEIERLKAERDDLQAAFNKGFETHRAAKESR